ncbi:hypothetical protein QVD17_19686 [Tagetes erecta]|uniref:Replication factor A C-terminal domain-containing protein n=1 Tax=Tagetes erecta TaxID=13708 RepID=A0AAD8KK15_TARER|nr:hypothetical protein QVD17_19686 [Tagetes erecta]
MEQNNITLIKNIHLTNDDLTLKLRIVRLWKLPDHINKKEVYSIEMILMDEEGTKIIGTVSKRFLSKFTRLLNENINIFVIKPNFSNERSSYKYHRGQVMSVTLFAEYAEKFIVYLQKNPEEVRFIVILQFGRIKWFQGKPVVNTSYNVTKLFINDDIKEIITFKKRKNMLLYWQPSLISSRRGYFGCTKCYKKVEPVILIDDKPKSPAEVDEPTIYRCTKCLIDVRIPIPRFRIEIRVQDHTGVVSLTLFDREAKKLLKVSTKDLIGSQSKEVIENDNVTPASHTEKSTATSPLVRAKNSAVSSRSSDLKRNLFDA